MFRKALLTLLMGMVLMGAAATETSLPVLLLMGSLILFALYATSVREDQQE